MELLLDAGADVNKVAVLPQQTSPKDYGDMRIPLLPLAIQLGFSEGVKLLLERGADLTKTHERT